jgi:hypothetical protein
MGAELSSVMKSLFNARVRVSAALSLMLLTSCTTSTAHQRPIITTLSTTPYHISGGDVLVQIAIPVGTKPADILVKLNGSDVTAAFTSSSDNQQMVGLVTALKPGDNTLQATPGTHAKGPDATITLSNYPITGPIVSGPHLSPYVCQTEQFKLPDGTSLGPAIDANCSIKPRIDYVYFSASEQRFKPLGTNTQLPSDTATAMTTTGLTVPFVVRLETRTINRGIYQSTVLHDPSTEQQPTPFSPPAGWNKRLIAVHGYGCPKGWYRQGEAQGVNPLDAKRLAEGYALFTNTLNHPTNSCNPVLAGETTMMGKEHFIETMGIPDFTVSIGSSGGAYTSLQIADAFPGLIDGVLIGSTFPDALSIALSAMDAQLIARYYLENNTAGFSESQIVAISGFKNARAWYDLALQSARTDPITNRKTSIPKSDLLKQYQSGWWAKGMPEQIRFSPENNPDGARATIFDTAKNIYGTDPKTGYAMRPFDNTGVQYGLQSLNSGIISVQQFIDLNAIIGGFDHNANPVAERSVAQTKTLKRSYQSGISLSGGGGLASIPVFDLSHLYDEDELYHYQWFHFAVRERMKNRNGHSDNHVMWRGGVAVRDHAQLGGKPSAEHLAMIQTIEAQSWQTFINWVSHYKADSSAASQLDKVIRHKPSAAQDGCFTKSLPSSFIAEQQTFSNAADSNCNTLWPSWSFVRKEAGGPLHANTLKCQLKPLNKDDYAISYSSEEWLAMTKTFPEGVCDWTQPGVVDSPVSPIK